MLQGTVLQGDGPPRRLFEMSIALGKCRQNIVISSRLYLVIVYLIVAQLWAPLYPASKVSETGLQIVSKLGISEDNGETADFGLTT